MHLDVPTASLIAQVFPVLLLALVVDGRLRRRKSRTTVFAFAIVIVRTTAAMGALMATFFAILIVSNGGPIKGYELLIDSVATVSLVALFVGLIAVLSRMLDRDSDTLVPRRR